MSVDYLVRDFVDLLYRRVESIRSLPVKHYRYDGSTDVEMNMLDIAIRARLTKDAHTGLY